MKFMLLWTTHKSIKTLWKLFNFTTSSWSAELPCWIMQRFVFLVLVVSLFLLISSSSSSNHSQRICYNNLLICLNDFVVIAIVKLELSLHEGEPFSYNVYVYEYECIMNVFMYACMCACIYRAIDLSLFLSLFCFFLSLIIC